MQDEYLEMIYKIGNEIRQYEVGKKRTKQRNFLGKLERKVAYLSLVIAEDGTLSEKQSDRLVSLCDKMEDAIIYFGMQAIEKRANEILGRVNVK